MEPITLTKTLLRWPPWPKLLAIPKNRPADSLSHIPENPNNKVGSLTINRQQILVQCKLITYI